MSVRKLSIDNSEKHINILLLLISSCHTNENDHIRKCNIKVYVRTQIKDIKCM